MKNSGDTIYLLNDNEKLQCVPRMHYDSEDMLQNLIQKYPSIVGGEQIGGEEAVRLILVKREAGIPDGEGCPDRWSVDHLLLDQNGIPTLVEVKRSSNPQIRREVVGQLLEYAANFEIYWSSDRIRSLAVEEHGGSEQLDHEILKLLDLDPETEVAENVEAYWAKVQDNLRNGKLRLLFVADELPREVRRIIEFLNSKMNDVEVLGVELRQYVGGNIRAMVPRIIGQTEATRQAKSMSGQVKRITQQEVIAGCPENLHPFIMEILDGSNNRGLTIYWGQKGFTVRTPTSENKLQSLYYFYMPGSNLSSEAYVEGYLDSLIRETEAGAILEEGFHKIPGFIKVGNFTFRMGLNPANLDSARKGLELVWKAAKMIHQAPSDK